MERKLPDGWEWKELHEIAEIEMGQSPPGASYNEDRVGLPFLQGNAEFGEENPEHNKWTSQPWKIVGKNTILISVRAPIGDINISDKQYCIGRGLAGINPKVCDVRYLYYYLRSIQPQLETRGTGSTFKAISKTILNSTLVPIPSLETQRKIVAILDKAEETKRLRAHANELTQKLLQSAFVEMFGDPIENPMNWPKYTINEITDKKYGVKRGPFGSALKKDSFAKSGFKIYEQSNVLKNDFTIGHYFIDSIKFEELKDFEIKSGDILVTCSGTGTVGKTAIVPEIIQRGIINQALMRITLNQKIVNREFFSTLFKLLILSKKLRNVRGSAIPNIVSMKEFREIKFPIPPLSEQQQFYRAYIATEALKSTQQNVTSITHTLLLKMNEGAFEGEIA